MLTLPQMTMLLWQFGWRRHLRIHMRGLRRGLEKARKRRSHDRSLRGLDVPGHSSPSISIAAARPLIGGSGW